MNHAPAVVSAKLALDENATADSLGEIAIWRVLRQTTRSHFRHSICSKGRMEEERKKKEQEV
jgi:hypothetical protein